VNRNWIASLLLAAATPIAAQDALYTEITPPSPDVTPPPTSRGVYASRINHDAIRVNPASISVAIPRSDDPVNVTVQRQQFVRRRGYAGEAPAPGSTATDLAYTWVGASTDYRLRLTYHRGAFTGVFYGPNGRFLITTTATSELRPEAFLFDDSAGNDAPPSTLALAKLDLAAQLTAPAAPKVSGPDDIDMLILYTEAARTTAFVPTQQVPTQPACGATTRGNDDILATINAAVVDTNTALANSAVVPRLGNVTLMRILNFPAPNGNPNDSRDNAALLSPNIQAMRTAVGADVVVVVTENFTTLGACGVAFVQRAGCTLPTPTPGCNVGAAFNAFAYTVVAQNCAIAFDSFVHELGHSLGGEHNPGVGAPMPNQASFVHSFGHFVPGNFETVMSIARPANTLQELNFSDPNIFVRGAATGIANQRHNALTVQTLSPAYRLFRDGPTFIDGFEDEPLCATMTF